MKHLVKILFLIALLPAGNAWSAVMSPETLNFSCITNNWEPNCNIGEQFMSVEVSSAGTSTTDFKFINGIPSSSVDGATIGEIYFMSSVLESFTASDIDIQNTGVVNFTLDNVVPPDLPGGSNVGFEATFGAQADQQLWPGSGIGAAETLVINLALSFDTFAMALMDNDFFIGIHVKRFNEANPDELVDGSESFITPNPIPIPATLWLFGTALIGFIGFARRTQL